MYLGYIFFFFPALLRFVTILMYVLLYGALLESITERAIIILQRIQLTLT